MLQNLKHSEENINKFTKENFDILEEYEILVNKNKLAKQTILDSLKIKALCSHGYSQKLYENLCEHDKQRLTRFASNPMFTMNIIDIVYNINDDMYYYYALRTNFNDEYVYESHPFTEEELNYFLKETL